jgi:hypothetical protein
VLGGKVMYTSEAATKAANKFIDMLQKGKFLKDTLPNSFENYSDYFEEADLESYRKYIKTFT